MKKKIENKTELKKGDALYEVWCTDNMDVYRITNIKVLNERVLDITVLLKGRYDRIGSLSYVSTRSRYTPFDNKQYTHVIATNDVIPSFITEGDFKIYTTESDALKRIKENESKLRDIKLLNSVKTIFEYLKQ